MFPTHDMGTAVQAMTGDPLSDVLQLVDARPAVAGGFSAGGAWAIRFPQPDKIKFFALIRGGCWLLLGEGFEPVRAEEGDVFLMSGDRDFVLASEPGVAPVDARGLFTGTAIKTATLGDGGDCVQIGGHVRLDPVNGALLSDVLPPLIHIRAGSPQAGILRWLIGRLGQEQAGGQPGSGVASAHLSHLMFVEMLRAHLESGSELPAGWLKAMADRRLASALRQMHAQPARAWRLEELAAAAAMSRTAFAVHFKAVMGMAPLAWLTQWRMRLARQALARGGTPIATLAEQLGYASESAFSTAFKRVVGEAPGLYRRERLA